MIPTTWTSALANHLWQSTLVAAVAALLALVLRNNHARTRYGLWLAASLKFLIPFSWLAGLGARLQWPSSAPLPQPKISAAVEQFALPFPQAPPAPLIAAAAHHVSLVPVALLAIWICGLLAVSIHWWRRWRRIRAAVNAASPVPLAAGVPVFVTDALLEPGIVGIFRPVLLLPKGITDQLAPAHLAAIIAHELCHVRRRDNLAAALHMAVEAIFWFHPLVWLIGARLIEERERACDEEVLRLGGKPEVYAESILKTCQFYLDSRLACVSGITGADLKQRIVRIMRPHLTRELSLSRRILLVATAATAIAAPVIFGLAKAAQNQAQSDAASDASLPSFEVASIKPNRTADRGTRLMLPPGRLSVSNGPVRMLVEFAYNLKPPQLEGGPGWIDSERYDIDAKMDDATAAAMRKVPFEEQHERVRLMVRSLLIDRFKLKVSRTTKELPIYALVVAKDGPKFHETTLPPPEPPDSDHPRPPGPQAQQRMSMFGPGELTLNGAAIRLLADMLSRQLGREVVDKTGLTGHYDMKLTFAPTARQPKMPGGPGDAPRPVDAPPPPDADAPSVFTALQEQLGLKLESQKGPVEIIAIDSIDHPTEN